MVTEYTIQELKEKLIIQLEASDIEYCDSSKGGYIDDFAKDIYN